MKVLLCALAFVPLAGTAFADAGAPAPDAPSAMFSGVPAVAPAAADRGAGTCDPDGVQPSGAIYRICMPPPGEWNGDLVVFAHGYVDPNEPVAIPEDQLGQLGQSLPEIVTALGYAFAVSSYRQNGLAILEGLDDLVELVDIFEQTYGPARYVYLTGASEGGLITALGVERRPDVFDAGLSTCGPTGNFALQLAYFGNMRVVYDYFFDTLPGSPTDIPGELYQNWPDVYRPQVEEALAANPAITEQIIRITRAPVDAADPVNTKISSIAGALGYQVRASTDAFNKLGGVPVGNRGIWYRGADQPILFNLGVERFDADPDAAATVEAFYQTSGEIQRPLVVMHTTGDEIIPYWHALLYYLKIAAAGELGRQVTIPIQRYGHCNFEVDEVLVGFTILVLRTQGTLLTGVEDVLPGAESAARYRALLEAELERMDNGAPPAGLLDVLAPRASEARVPAIRGD
ncbi:MAG: prolyl oligopeptidase family serine peptidase [Phycisphaerae bacterium]|jgi:hypothetical protein